MNFYYKIQRRSSWGRGGRGGVGIRPSEGAGGSSRFIESFSVIGGTIVSSGLGASFLAHFLGHLPKDPLGFLLL